jgi:hypothetical protein
MSIQLGDLVKDKISGFTGIAVAKTQWLTGCDRIDVQPREMHEGRPIEAQWFDVTMLDVVEVGVIPCQNGGPQPDGPSVNKSEAPAPGGPRNDPKSRW